MKGNEAMAEAAIRAGCRHFFGYPITPQTEVAAYMSKKMPKIGGTYLQAESEIAAINMVLGAASAGVRAMTSSSSPGISLKTEGISYIAGSDLPCLIVNVERGGPGLGGIQPAQSDYWQATRALGHGDFHVLVFAPSTVQEVVDLVFLAYDLAEKYRMPALLLSDGLLGQMMEPVEFPPFKERKEDLGWTFDGTDRPHGRIDNPGKPGALRAKVEAIMANEQRWENYMVEDADYVFVAFGLPSRTSRNAVDQLREQGIKAGLIRPITVWPFPFDAFKAVPDSVKGIISVESTDAGQLIEDVALATKRMCRGNVPVYGLFSGQKIPKTKEIVTYVNGILSGENKEVF